MRSLASSRISTASYTIFYSVILILVGGFTTTAQVKDTHETAIKQVLAKQVTAWNQGNIEEFMKGYWQSDSLVFIGKNGPNYGYKTTLENYKNRYPDTSAMGKLTFNILQIKRLSFDYCFIIGKWHLQRSMGDLAGHFTLLFKRLKNNWVIIADHSS